MIRLRENQSLHMRGVRMDDECVPYSSASDLARAIGSVIGVEADDDGMD